VLASLVGIGMHLGPAVSATTTAVSQMSNPSSDGVPFCALGIDGGPHMPGCRDNVFVIDRAGMVLEAWEIHGPQDLAMFHEQHPDLPTFGPLHVLASDVRDMRRVARNSDMVGRKVERKP
jgi:hypothetical protein